MQNSSRPLRAPVRRLSGAVALIGFAIACWIFSFYTFGHPEKPMSYAILTKLKADAETRLGEPVNVLITIELAFTLR